MLNVAVFGVGEMGGMLVRARSRFATDSRFVLSAANRSEERLYALALRVPKLRTGPIEEIAADADLLFLCVPPNAYLERAAALTGVMKKNAIFISITNGVGLDDLAKVVKQPIVKVVPSLANEAGQGVALMISGPRATPVHLALVKDFMTPFSNIFEINEADARVGTNITGCGPALIACFAEVLAQSANEFSRGLTMQQLDEMCRQTVIGVGALLAQGLTLEQIIERVATPEGSTEAALIILRAQLPTVLERMHRATSRRLVKNSEFSK